MKISKNNIEGLFKEGLKDFSANPSSSVWTKINRNLGFRNFFKFNPGKLNIYYTVVIGITASIAFYNISNNKTITENKQVITKNEIALTENNIQDNTINSNNKTKNQTIEINNKESIQNNISNNEINKTEKNITIIDIVRDTDNVKDISTKVESNNEDKKNVILALEPLADFSASTNEACVPVAVQFTNASENCNSYLWDFGNGETSSETNPTFVFRAAGIHTVTLTVQSGSISKTAKTTIIVNPKPNSEFIISDKENIFENDEVKFANLCTGHQSCVWYFGDESTSTFTHPTHSYDNAGYYNISLICFSDKNCSDTSEFSNLQVRDSKYLVIAPTGFKIDKNGPQNGYLPAGTNSNFIFKPIFNYELSNYNLRIYNRFGSIVFETNDPNYGWNGYLNNQVVPDDTYVWICSGTFADGEKFIKTGDVTPFYITNQ